MLHLPRTLLDDERDLVAGKRGPTRLGFALILRFYARYGRFPAGRSELPDEAVAFVAKQVKVPASDLGFYEWSGSMIEYHRNQVREHLGFRVCSVADAIKDGTATTEAVLSRFTRSATHPAYQAMLEIGRAQKTIFVARYLRDRGLQREIEEGLNVVESWNGANAVICYGRGGDISTNRRDEVEMTALCLRILQAALVYVNTLMLQDVLADGTWSGLLGEADRRGLTPLFWEHVRPYGEVRLDMGSRLRIGGSG